MRNWIILSVLMFSYVESSSQTPNMPAWHSQNPIPISKSQCFNRAVAAIEASSLQRQSTQDGWMSVGTSSDLRGSIYCTSCGSESFVSVIVAGVRNQGTKANEMRDFLRYYMLNGKAPSADPVIGIGQGTDSPGGDEPDDRTYRKIKWGDTGNGIKNPDGSLKKKEGDTLCLECGQKDSQSSRLFGTDEYQYSSSPCYAAKHAGVIGDQGGKFCIRFTKLRSSYPGSKQNGVASSDWLKNTRGLSYVVEGLDNTVVANDPYIQLDPPVDEWKVDFGPFDIKNGQIDARPAGDGKTSYFLAPTSYHGNWKGKSTLSFDKKSWGGSYYGPVSYGAYGDVVISNGSMIARYDITQDHSQKWKTYSIPLNGSGWKLSGGALNLQQVLSNVTSFKIRAEYGAGTDYSSIKNIVVK